MSEEVEKTNAGVKKKGDWKEVAEFGEEVKEAVSGEIDEQSAEKFDEWRPKHGEAENDMKKKTVDIAVIPEKKMEEESKGVKGDFKDATQKVAKAGKKAARKERPAAEITGASEDVAKPFYKKAAEAFRKLERLVYNKLALRHDHYYLDTEKLSADMKSKRNGYELDVSLPERESREKIRRKLEEKDE